MSQYKKPKSDLIVLNQLYSSFVKISFSLRQIAEPKISDSHANQSQRRMPNRRRHFANLPVFAFNQFQTDPAMGNGLRNEWADSGRDGLAAPSGHRSAITHLWFGFQNPCAAWQRFSGLESKLHFPISPNFRRRNFSTGPNTSRPCALRGCNNFSFHFASSLNSSKPSDPRQSGHRINIFGKPNSASVRFFEPSGELRQHANGFN